MKLKFIISSATILVIGVFIILNCKGKEKVCAVNSIRDLKNLFPTTVKEIENNLQKSKTITEDTVNQIISIPNDKKTYQNSVLALDKMGYKLAPLTHIFEIIENVNPSKELRDAAHDAILKLSEFSVKEISTNKKLYEALKYYYDNQFKEEKDRLSKEEIYFLDKTITDFEKSGLNLPEEELEKIRKLLQEISKLELKFQQNINDDSSQIEVTLDQLKGTPEQVINALEKTKDGKYILKTDYPTVFGILEFCEIQETRKELSRIFNNRAYPQNYDVLRQLLVKKYEHAKLLGYKDFAHLDIEDNMAKSPEKVKEFINNLVDKSKLKAKNEIDLFTKDLHDKTLFNKDGKIKPWNTAFIKMQYKKNHLNLDEKEVAKYFPLEHTIQELLDIYQKFLNLEFKTVEVNGFWHPDVKLIEVYKNNRLIGYIILDLHPRPNKFSHACDMSVIPAIEGQDACPAVSVVVANFTQPSPPAILSERSKSKGATAGTAKSTKEAPSLLTLNEVTTFFHEFGHAMHDLLGKTKIASFSGVNVKSDFVELPSQMLESWLNDKEILKKVSQHYQTKQPLPDDLIEKIAELEKLDSGDFVLRQLSLALMSLDLFDDNPNKNFDELTKQINKKLRDYMMQDPEHHVIASFGHLGTSLYGSKYYGYMWSNVFAYDLFAKIKHGGLLNGKMGQEYIDKVIGKGGSQDPNELLEDFLGRKPNEQAFLAAMGFTS